MDLFQPLDLQRDRSWAKLSYARIDTTPNASFRFGQKLRTRILAEHQSQPISDLHVVTIPVRILASQLLKPPKSPMAACNEAFCAFVDVVCN